jgi:chaperonin GroES
MRDHVLVRRLPDADEGPIKSPEGSRPKPQRGTVLAVGPGLIAERMAPYVTQAFDVTFTRLPMDVKIGDVVVFGKYAGSNPIPEDDDLIDMREDEIIGVVPTPPSKIFEVVK